MSEPATSRRRLAVAIAMLVALGTIGVYVAGTSRLFATRDFQYDLTAFYCGGQVVAEHQDPYRIEPLRTCERRSGTILSRGSKLAIPDPLPPYDQGLFAVVSRVPFSVLFVVWPFLEIAAFVVTTTFLVRLTGLPVIVVGGALLMSDLYCSLALGQIAAFSILGLVIAGWALERGRRAVLAAGLTLAMLEPHLGLPALVAAAIIGDGKSRVASEVAVASLAFVSIVSLPVATTIEYVLRVSSIHALSEINNQEQFSAAYALHLLGLSERTSVTLGALDYAVMLALGLYFAKRVVNRFGRAALVFVPTAFVLIGGPFLHMTQMAAALPAALLLAARSPRSATGGAVAMLSIPWSAFTGVTALLPLSTAVLFLMFSRVAKLGPLVSASLAGLALSAECLADFLLLSATPPARPSYERILASDFPEIAWKTIIDSQAHQHVLLSVFAKLPTELALVAIVAAVVRESFAGRGLGHVVIARPVVAPATRARVHGRGSST